MTKLEFMKELESLLSDIPLEEREEALNYYNGYIEDAGEEHEEDILKELGSPAKVAGIIKADLNSDAEERENRGYFTEKGYQDTIYQDKQFELVGSGKIENGDTQSDHQQTGNTGYSYNTNNNQSTAQGDPKRTPNTNSNSDGSRIALIILLCFFGFPIVMTIFGVVVGIISAILGIILGFGVAGIAMFGVGIAMVFTGITQIGVPFIGLLLCGAGLLVFGLGMLFILASVLLCRYVLPAIFKGIVNLCRMPFQNRSVMA